MTCWSRHGSSWPPGFESIAICFINSYRNPAHEQRAEAIIRAAFPDLLRLCVTRRAAGDEGVRADLARPWSMPICCAQMRRYLQRLESGLARTLGIAAPVLVMTSNGGMIAASTAGEKPVLVVASGPAGGVVGGSRLAQARGEKDTIVFDMGGTTAKAVIIEDGQPSMTSEYEFRDGISTSSRFIKAGGYMLKVPGHRHRGSRRRRRLARQHRSWRAAAGRPGIGGRRPRPRLLQPRQRSTDRHRRERRARLYQPDGARRRPVADRQGASRRRRSRPTSRARSASASRTRRTASGRWRMPPWGARSAP